MIEGFAHDQWLAHILTRPHQKPRGTEYFVTVKNMKETVKDHEINCEAEAMVWFSQSQYLNCKHPSYKHPRNTCHTISWELLCSYGLNQHYI